MMDGFIIAKESALLLVPIATIILGFIIGWLGQRSGFCSIGGIRDYILFRHTRLLKGYIILIISASVFYFIFSIIAPTTIPKFLWCVQENQLFTAIGGAPTVSAVGTIFLMIIGGIFVGMIGTLLGGCPLRQLVMTSEGNLKSLAFMIGMFSGAIIFTVIITPWIIEIFNIIGL
ncbi:MAG TPA: YeeE/YedE thiosulfate transporter family protein [Methanocorpusculum sp.]|nr:YeeE/YedE thiosulfate transporter family protein [Methanocorpusculum sp.]